MTLNFLRHLRDLECPCRQRYRSLQRHTPTHVSVQHTLRQPSRYQCSDQRSPVVRQQSALSVQRSHDEAIASQLLRFHGHPRIGAFHLAGVWIKPNTHRRRRRDETVELSRVGGVYRIRN